MLFFFESTWPMLSVIVLALAMIAYGLQRKMIMTILLLAAVVVLIAGAFFFKDY
mgnify:CR=1 FL=1